MLRMKMTYTRMLCQMYGHTKKYKISKECIKENVGGCISIEDKMRNMFKIVWIYKEETYACQYARYNLMRTNFNSQVEQGLL